MIKPAKYWIEKLNLQAHPEGGWYTETYRSEDIINKSSKNEERNISTCIYFLLQANDISVFHRLKSDEIWHFYTGDSSIKISIINVEGILEEKLLGNNPDYDETLQHVITKNNWFAAELTNKSGYALIGCTVSPGFDFEDFEFGNRELLINQYPQLEQAIVRLTKSN